MDMPLYFCEAPRLNFAPVANATPHAWSSRKVQADVERRRVGTQQAANSAIHNIE